MQGSISQSFFFLDQLQYKVAKGIYYGHTKAGEVGGKASGDNEDDAMMEEDDIDKNDLSDFQEILTFQNDEDMEGFEDFGNDD